MSASLINEIYENLLEKSSIEGMVAALKEIQRPQPLSKQNKEISLRLKKLSDHLLNNCEKEAYALALTVIFVDADYAIGKMRRQGMLRASKYNYNSSLIKEISQVVIRENDLFRCNDKRVDYLKSIQALVSLAPEAKKIHDRIIKKLKIKKSVAMKIVLWFLNNSFVNHWCGNDDGGSLTLSRYSSEEIAEAVSLIWGVYKNLFTISDSCFDVIEKPNYIEAREFHAGLIILASLLVKFNDAEIMIDGLPFQAKCEGKRLCIYATNPEIEKSIRIGFMPEQALLQGYKDTFYIDLQSISSYVDGIFKEGLEDHYLITTTRPVRRLTIKFSLDPELLNIFRTNNLYGEEETILSQESADNFTELNTNQNISPYLTIMDVVKFKRLFHFISALYQKKMSRIKKGKRRFYLSVKSSILIMPYNNLFHIINAIFEDEDKSKNIIKLFTTKDKGEHIDLQYKPLINLGSHYAIAPHLIAVSNLTRNMIVANGLREFIIKNDDTMITRVEDSLKKSGFKVGRDFKVSKRGNLPEIDLIAWRENALFIFECKNNYQPCSIHEIRNSYEAIDKAKKQLDVRYEKFTDPNNQKTLFKAIGWDVPPTDQVYTGIVIANRTFHGADFNGHRVCDAHELINVLENGLISYGNYRNLWKGNSFSTDDLIEYLTRDSIVKKQFQAFEKKEDEFNFGDRFLVFGRHYLDEERMRKIIEHHYPLAKIDIKPRCNKKEHKPPRLC